MALPIKHRDLWSAVTARFASKFGTQRASDISLYDSSASSGFVDRWSSADGTQDIDVVGTDAYDRVGVGAAAVRPLRTPLVFNLATNGAQTTQRFFVADQPYEIRAIALQYDTADGAANTAVVTKETAGQAAGTGTVVMTNTFNLNTTTNVPQVATLPARNQPGVFGPQEGVIALNTGEMLSLKIASAVTNLAGVNVTVQALPANSLPPAVININANASIATQTFYLANRPVNITGITVVAGTPTSASGTLTVTHDTSTNAPGAGTACFTAITPNAATTPANTPTAMTLTSTAATLALAAGDRLALKISGTITALAGLVVVVSFSNGNHQAFVVGTPVAGMTQATFVAPANVAVGTAAGFFIADRDYRVDDVSMVWSTAGSGDVTVTVDGNTTASGGGTSVLTDNSNHGPATTSAANTPVVGTLAVSKRTILLPAGSRLGIAYNGTLGSLAGLVVAVTLLPF